MPSRLKTHTLTLRGERMTLRPMTEDDWDLLLRWNSDPEVLYYSEGDDVEFRTLAEVQSIYRGVSQQALCFIAEVGGTSIGEGWLQRLNLPRLLEQHPGLDCRRIDLAIGEKSCWGKGLGTEMIRLLVDLGFGHEGADLIFGCEVGDYNPRSLRAFEKTGFQICERLAQPPGDKARFRYDLVLARAQFWSG